MKHVCTAVLLITMAFSSAFSQDMDAQIEQSRTLQNSGRFKEAVDLLRQAADAAPGNAQARLALGQALSAWGGHAAQNGDLTTAMQAMTGCFEEMEKAIELAPDWFEAHFYYGVYAVMVPPFFGKLDQGLSRLEKSLTWLEENSYAAYKPAVYRFLGQGYQQKGSAEQAIAAYRKVLETAGTGEHAEAARKGLAALQKTDTETPAEPGSGKDKRPETSRTIQKLQDKAEQEPDEFSNWYRLGEALFEEKRYPEAIESLKKATALNPDHAEGAFLLARAFSEEATPGYDERVYENQDWRTHLAFEAARWLEKAWQLDPDNAEIKLHHAIGSVTMPFFVNRLDRGIDLLQQIIDDGNVSPAVKQEARYFLGYAYRKKGNAYWLKLVREYPDAEPSEWVYMEYGLRDTTARAAPDGKHLSVRFHLGFLDELPPQTAVWVEDDNGRFIRTLYVSGFSAFAREKQVNLPVWSKSSRFEADGVTGASIDWGKHRYYWDLKAADGRRVKDGVYRIHVEAAWWPSMKYSRTHVAIHTGSKSAKVTGGDSPLIPLLEAEIRNPGRTP